MERSCYSGPFFVWPKLGNVDTAFSDVSPASNPCVYVQVVPCKSDGIRNHRRNGKEDSRVPEALADQVGVDAWIGEVGAELRHFSRWFTS